MDELARETRDIGTTTISSLARWNSATFPKTLHQPETISELGERDLAMNCQKEGAHKRTHKRHVKFQSRFEKSVQESKAKKTDDGNQRIQRCCTAR